MPTPCINCRLNKKKVLFDIEKAQTEAKRLAVQNEKTYAVYQQGKVYFYSEANEAIANGNEIIGFFSKYD